MQQSAEASDCHATGLAVTCPRLHLQASNCTFSHPLALAAVLGGGGGGGLGCELSVSLQETSPLVARFHASGRMGMGWRWGRAEGTRVVVSIIIIIIRGSLPRPCPGAGRPACQLDLCALAGAEGFVRRGCVGMACIA